jgi:hypothetical protein
MEIKGSGRIDSANVRRTGKSSAQGGSSFTVSDTAETARAQTPAAPGPIGSIDTILMLQGLDDSASGRSKGLAQGNALLDMLDEVRDGLLAGGIPRATLNRLAVAVGRRRETFTDPKLESVLDEIELRARVELAKLEQADQHYA